MTKQFSKGQVEGCMTLGPPRGPLRDIKGIWYWARHGTFVDYRVVVTSESLQLSFERGGVPIQQFIQLVSTEPNYGGIR